MTGSKLHGRSPGGQLVEVEIDCGRQMIKLVSKDTEGLDSKVYDCGTWPGPRGMCSVQPRDELSFDTADA